MSYENVTLVDKICLYTLKRIANWSLYKIWYNVIYSINVLQCKQQSIGLQKENTCSCTKPSMRNGGCKIAFVLEFLVHGMEFVKFDRNVFLLDCLSKKISNMARWALQNAHKPSEWFVPALPSDRLLGFSIGDISVFRVSGRNTYTQEVLEISYESPKEEWPIPYRTFKLSMTIFRIVLPWHRRRHVIQWAEQSIRRQCAIIWGPLSCGPMFYLSTKHALHYAGADQWELSGRMGYLWGDSIMLWAGVHTKPQIVPIQGNLNVMRYQNNVIRPFLLPHIRANCGLMFTQNNAPCHAARNTQTMLVANKVQTLQWPAKVPI